MTAGLNGNKLEYAKSNTTRRAGAMMKAPERAMGTREKRP